MKSVSELLSALHWAHWFVLCLSLVLTVFAWQFSQAQVEEKNAERFEYEADQSVALLLERMERYESGLWAGVGLIQALGPERGLGRQDWVGFAESIDLVGKYPGINGIGVIYQIGQSQLNDYVSRYAQGYPEIEVFGAHPKVDSESHFVITFIEPFIGNEKAVGLDMAFETNRLNGAQRALASGTAQISGPIVLVQDTGKTPGFLFYAPFYHRNAGVPTVKNTAGMVYAPFVVQKLMEGTLDKDRRSVAMRVSDGETVLYDEHQTDDVDFDPDPVHSKKIRLDLYGRSWDFDVRSTLAFRRNTSNTQPLSILFAGLLIDGLILGLFIVLTRSNKRALVLAEGMTHELRDKSLLLMAANERLSSSNEELEEFSYVASHDLQEPLRTLQTYCDYLHTDLIRESEVKPSERVQQDLRFISEAAQRMRNLIAGLLEYSHAGRKEIKPEPVDLNSCFKTISSDLEALINAKEAALKIKLLPVVQGDPVLLPRALQNLLHNALKFNVEGTPPKVTVDSYSENEQTVVIRIKDNGIGIDPKYQKQIFGAFKRLHGIGEYPGAGIGLAVVKKIIDRHGGVITINSKSGAGSEFCISLKRAA